MVEFQLEHVFLVIFILNMERKPNVVGSSSGDNQRQGWHSGLVVEGVLSRVSTILHLHTPCAYTHLKTPERFLCFLCETSHLHGGMLSSCLDLGFLVLPGRFRDPEEDLAFDGGKRCKVLSRATR